MPEAADRAHRSPQGNDDLQLGSGGGQRRVAGGNQPDPATPRVPAFKMCAPPACFSHEALRNGCSVAPMAARSARRIERERGMARVLRYGPLERAATGILLCMALHWGVAVGRGQGENELRAVEAVPFTWCGDGKCEASSENAGWCASDCSCGDNVCDNAELSSSSCPSDCFSFVRFATMPGNASGFQPVFPQPVVDVIDAAGDLAFTTAAVPPPPSSSSLRLSSLELSDTQVYAP